MSSSSRYWRRKRSDRDGDRSGSDDSASSSKPSRSTSPQIVPSYPKSPTQKKQPSSPKSSPLLRRLSTFIKQKGSSRSKLVSASKLKKKIIKHAFDHLHLIQPTWCDHCDDIIWGLLRPCVQCNRCNVTCHFDCAENIELSCLQSESTAPKIPHVHPKQTQDGIDAGAQGLLAYLTSDDITKKIQQYNRTRESNFIEMLDSELQSKNFKGHIRVTLNLTRPIRVSSRDSFVNNSPEQSECLSVSVSPALVPVASRLLRSSSSEFNFDSGSNPLEGETFFLPKHVSKGLYVTSATTAQEVIAILLRKFRVTSNPRKFALFECNKHTGSERRLRRFEEPLALQLLWGESSEQFELTLKEYNQDYEFHWEEFSLAELENFAKILEQEEMAACQQIKDSYEVQRRALEQLLVKTRETSSLNDIESTKPVDIPHVSKTDQSGNDVEHIKEEFVDDNGNLSSGGGGGGDNDNDGDEGFEQQNDIVSSGPSEPSGEISALDIDCIYNKEPAGSNLTTISEDSCGDGVHGANHSACAHEDEIDGDQNDTAHLDSSSAATVSQQSIDDGTSHFGFCSGSSNVQHVNDDNSPSLQKASTNQHSDDK